MVSVALAPARTRVARHRGYWRLTVALVLLLVAASLSLSGLIIGLGWWALMVFVGSLILVFGAVMRMVGVPRFIVPLTEIGLFAVIMTVGFGAGSGLLGVIPTPATFAQFGALIQQAKASIYEQAAPAPELPEFMFLIAAGAGGFAILTDFVSITLRKPLLAGLALVLVAVAPASLSQGITPTALAECAAAFLFLLRADVRTRRPGTPRLAPALSIAAVAVVASLAVAVTVPGFSPGGTTSFTPGGISIGGSVAPLVDIGQDLRRPAAVEALSYTTTAQDPPYLKLASLDIFTGTVWKHRASVTKPLPRTDTIGPATGLSSKVATKKVTTSIHIDDMLSNWLPVPSPVIGVHGLSGSWSWDPSDLTIGAVNDQTSTSNQSYTAESVQIEPTPLQLKDAGGQVPKTIQRDLALPSAVPAVIVQTAKKATAGATSEYEEAVDLQNYFRDNGFRYSLNTPLKQGYDGDGLAVIARFLQAKAGYCVHFASAMAVMARTLGIPSRVAMGYLPGSSSNGAVSGPSSYTVTSDDLHAWPELYFAGVGWVGFEPTVGQGTIPSYTLPNQAAAPQAAASAPTSAPTTAPLTSGGRKIATDTGASGQTSVAQPALSGFGVAVLVILVLLVPAIVRRVRRRNRYRRLRDDWGDGNLAWAELRDTARDVGWAVPNTETPRMFAERISSTLGTADQVRALERLLTEVEREKFGPPQRRMVPAGLADDTALVVLAFESHAGWAGRIRARLVPFSLIPEGWISPGGLAATNG